jgi:2-polyprenyl-3-methyl-5-hydroxy-6-metoxy-1,4-benzoquinol methylase
MTQVDPHWYETFFGDDYLTVAPRDLERTARELDFVLEQVELEPGARILDVACGHGRHALELTRRGYRVTGIDLSEPSLSRAREAAAAEGLEVELVHGDARELSREHEFDAAINLFSSVVGYFEEQAEDERVLGAVARALRPGGSFLLDTVNLFVLAREFRARWWEELEDGRTMLEERAYDPLSGRTAATWTFVAPDGQRSDLRHSMRIYTLPELGRMLAGAGLEVTGSFGGFGGEPPGFEARRLIVHARRRV